MELSNNTSRFMEQSEKAGQLMEKSERNRAIFINFGRLYGMQATPEQLAKEMGMSTEECEKLAKQFRERFPAINFLVPDFSMVEHRVLADMAGQEDQGCFSAPSGKLALRKSRTRMMVKAQRESFCIKGNLAIVFERANNSFTFSYRGTPILKWEIGFDRISEVYAGQYESSPSTRNQRKMAREAIDEYKERLLR